MPSPFSLTRVISALLWLLISFGAIIASTSNESPLTPPNGFEWRTLKEIDGQFLCPKGCSSKKTEGDSFTHLQFSDKNHLETTEASWSLRFQIFKNKNEASEFAKEMISLSAEENTVLENQPSYRISENVYFGVKVKIVLDEDLTVVQKHVAIANNSTDSVCVVIFEAPENSWLEEWEKTGRVIMESLDVFSVK